MSDNILLLIFAVSLAAGALLAFLLAFFDLDPAKDQITKQVVVWVLYTGIAGALAVVALAPFGRSGDLGTIPAISAFFMDGVILAAAATHPDSFASFFKSRDDLSRLLSSRGVIRASRYLTAAYFLMVGLFKWITYAEFPFFQASGYSKAFYIFICAFECVCAVGLLFQKTVLPVVLVLTVEMLGAVYTHFHNYFARGIPDPFSNSLDAFRTLVLLGYIAIATVPRGYFPTSRAQNARENLS